LLAGLIQDPYMQDFFHDNQSFLILDHLMLNSTHFEFMAFSFYLSIYKIYTLLSFKDEFFFTFIVNSDLWLHSSSSDLLQIVDHLQNNLSKDFPDVLSFQAFLNFWQIYFWYEPLETSIIRTQEYRNIDSETIHLICKNLIEILMKGYTSKITANNFELLLSHIMTIQDIPQIFDLIELSFKLVEAHIFLSMKMFFMAYRRF
jgi:hypothetical protein